jgi:predicted methyltransferase
MKIMAILIAVVALVSGAFATDYASNSTAATMAVADPSRPDSDTTRDADRKPAQTLVFAGIKPGDKVADYVADEGYFTRLFPASLGPRVTFTPWSPPHSSSSSISLREWRICRVLPSPIRT